MRSLHLRVPLRRIVWVAILATALVAVSAQAQPRSTQAAIASVWLPHDNGYVDVPRIALDAANGTHATFYTASDVNDNPGKVFYAYCASNCARATSWGSVVVGTIGTLGGAAQIAVDRSGHPRMLWHYQASLFSENTEIKYAACEGGCLTAANWTVTTVATPAQFDPDAEGQSQFFALDRLDRPRFIYHDLLASPSAYYYAYCDTGCSNAANWSRVALNAQVYGSVWLAFTPANQPRVGYYTASGSFSAPDHLTYIECNAACEQAANWSAPVELFPIVSNYFYSLGSAYAFHLDNNGQPRLVYYSGTLASGNPDNNTLFYAWCHSGCTSAANWERSAVGVPPSNGDGPDLAFDHADRPHIIYHNDQDATPGYSLGYGTCSANCETTSPAWQQSYLVDPATFPLPQLPCLLKLNFWYIKTSNALALDSADNPQVVYAATNLCDFGNDTVQEIRLAGFSMPDASGSPDGAKVYLPLIVR
jgi:hypothetical protein